MESASKRRISPVWEIFGPMTPDKAKSLLSSKEFRYNNKTSSMLRHYCDLHDNKEATGTSPSQGEASTSAASSRDGKLEN